MAATTTPTLATSADGTPIAYEPSGTGRPIVLIGGAFNDRSTCAGLAAALVDTSAAIAPVLIDRRGRGASGGHRVDHDPACEVEDVAAVIEAVGGAADLFGHSSVRCSRSSACWRGCRCAAWPCTSRRSW